MRGRKPKPTYLRIIEGNAGKRPLNHDEPAPIGELVEADAPAWLTPAQRLLWRQVILAAPPGLLRTLDGPLVATYAVAMDMQREACEGLGKYGVLVKSPDSGAPIKSPWSTIFNQATQTLVRAGAELGFSPASRSRVKITGAKKARSVFSDLRSLDVGGEDTTKV